MFTVTERAIDAIKGFLEKQQGSHAIRIVSQAGCCGGATLGMALDQQPPTTLSRAQYPGDGSRYDR